MIGPVLGVAIWNPRWHLPEGPRWLIMHDREQETEENVSLIQGELEDSGQELEPVDESQAIEVKATDPHGYPPLVLFKTYPQRSVSAPPWNRPTTHRTTPRRPRPR